MDPLVAIVPIVAVVVVVDVAAEIVMMMTMKNSPGYRDIGHTPYQTDSVPGKFPVVGHLLPTQPPYQQHPSNRPP